MRIRLKEIECLLYNMEDNDILKQLSVDLHVILHKYSEFVSKEKGLIVRLKVTSSSEQAHKLKQKYK